MRILIVDPEYLVAMEAERILSEALGCEVHIAMPRNYPAVLDSQNFDVVLVDTSLIRNAEAERRLRSADTSVVFSTLIGEEAAGLPAWPGVGVAPKPFDDQQLIRFVKNAAQR